MGCTFHRYCQQTGEKSLLLALFELRFWRWWMEMRDCMTIVNGCRYSLISLFYCQRSELVIPPLFIFLRQSEIWAPVSGSGARREERMRRSILRAMTTWNTTDFILFVQPYFHRWHMSMVSEKGGGQDISNQFTHASCLIIKLQDSSRFSRMRHAFDECLSAKLIWMARGVCKAVCTCFTRQQINSFRSAVISSASLRQRTDENIFSRRKLNFLNSKKKVISDRQTTLKESIILAKFFALPCLPEWSAHLKLITMELLSSLVEVKLDGEVCRKIVVSLSEKAFIKTVPRTPPHPTNVQKCF